MEHKMHKIFKTSPLDARIMYGKTYRSNYSATTLDKTIITELFDKQLEQTEAAEIMSKNLVSIDLGDLAIAAIDFYNKLTVDDADKIHLDWTLSDYSEKARRYTVEYNWFQLYQHYKIKKYVSPLYFPETVKDMLIKIQWEMYRQLPEHYDKSDYQFNLDWNLFNFWLDCISDTVIYEDMSV